MGEQRARRDRRGSPRRTPPPRRCSAHVRAESVRAVPAASMICLNFYFILAFSVKGLHALPVLLNRDYSKNLHSDTSVSLLAEGLAEDVEGADVEGAETEGTEEEAETPSKPLPEGQFEEPPAESSWVCRYSSGNRGPCFERRDAIVPPGRYCLPGTCCSKTVVKEDQMGMWCATEPIFCNGLVYFREYSFDECSCWKAQSRCHKAADCVDQPEPMRGVFCKCKKGYVGDGKKCLRDPCDTSNPCGSHGTCVGDTQGGYKCKCAGDYVEAEVQGMKVCRKKTACEMDPQTCGPPEGVQKCVPNGDGFACFCKPGWKAAPGLNQKCEAVISACASNPCGTERGVASCTDLEDGGYTCECKPGYVLDTVDGKQHCRSLRNDPCRRDVCGKPRLVEACVETDAGWRCTCKVAAYLAGPENEPYCAEDLTVLYGLVGAVGLFVAVVGTCYCCECREKRSTQHEEDDYDAYKVDYSHYAQSGDYL